MTATSHIRVFVEWAEKTVFAGEDVECLITFKNIATAPSNSNSHRASPKTPASNGFTPASERSKAPRTPDASGQNHFPNSCGVSPTAQRHRSTVSLGTPSINGRSPREASVSGRAGHSKVNAGGNIHKHSLSIISIGASEETLNVARTETGESGGRLVKSHGRAASLQIMPGRNGLTDLGPLTAPMSRNPIHSSFGSLGTSPSGSPRFPDTFPPRRNLASAPNTPGRSQSRHGSNKNSPMTPMHFKFPASPRELRSKGSSNELLSSKTSHKWSGSVSPRSDIPPIIMEQCTPPTTILSPSSFNGTPRSSGEFYSQSNNSTETLASEYLPQQGGRVWARPPHVRKQSNLVPTNHHRPPETLMMGYAQINGSFTLDGSLINQAPFEEVKRKGVVGGQGGGVVGLETGKRESGLLGAFGWGNFGQSLGGLLGGNELSSIKDLRGLASSRTIPLLSTPQSILFVDLRLAPGESKTYKYSFKIPRGLPPSHRGKTIKVSYHLVIGTQRPGGAKEQQVKSVEIPFRLLGSVNDHGELLGHDLMSPYIILRDQAQVQSLDHIHSSLKNTPQRLNTPKKAPSESSLDDFLAYVDELLNRPRLNSSLGLLSPTAPVPNSRRPSSSNEVPTAKEAIDMAILRSNITTRSQQSANRFEIARNRRRVAVIMLARPAWRLGETITAAIDFTDSEVPCYAINVALESSEKVDPAIALRSHASIQRVTRRVHAAQAESALFARRIVFSPTIPVSATPAFITSGISLEWTIRIEFVTPVLQDGDFPAPSHRNAEDGGGGGSLRGADGPLLDGAAADFPSGLLEEVSRDERGRVLAAVEQLRCESFEIAVPILVYGAVVGGAVTERSDGDGKVGLAV